MGRNRSPNREKAFEIYKESRGEITSKDIADILNEKVCNINNWRIQDKWRLKLHNKIGAPYDNDNAIGNEGGGAPEKNQNHYIHGFYSKYLPQQVYDIMKDIENMNPIDFIWQSIKMKYAAIINAQKIMFVKDHEDTTKELKKTKVQSDMVGPKGNKQLTETYREEEYELQFAWDKQATFLKAQARAMGELRSLIKQYEEMLKGDLATEEQKLRIEKLKTSINTTNDDIQSRKRIAEEKLQLEKERFAHQKKMDDSKVW